LLDSLQLFAKLDVDLSLLHTPSPLLRVRLGVLPSAQLARLRDAAALTGVVVTEFGRTTHQSYVILAMLVGTPEAEMVRLLHAAQFHPLEIPAAFHATPVQVRQELQAQLTTLAAQAGELERERQLWWVRHRVELEATTARLAWAAPYLHLGDAVRARGELCLLCGWVPHDRVAELEQMLREALGTPFVLHTRSPLPAERAQTPSDTLIPTWLAGFAVLVRQYGVPCYGELDPTLLFAVGFSLMFGMMFGDVGHGLVLAGAALWLPSGLAWLRVPLLSAGLCSAGFGLLYGSVFGVEHWLTPLWLAPLADPRQLLAAALYGGMGFVLIALLLAALALWQEGAHWAALFAPRGLAGAALYLAGIAALLSAWEGHTLSELQVLALGIPLATLCIYAGREPTGAPLFERLGVALIEIFETALGLLANTLSFLRVAAFGLNHAALMLAVFAIAGGIEGWGQGLALVLGNVMVIVLEGAIVLIQVLRLSFYEGFSRYYTGAGRPFTPLKFGG
jgi:V/A-type H+-transporting ATPase subunit I